MGSDEEEILRMNFFTNIYNTYDMLYNYYNTPIANYEYYSLIIYSYNILCILYYVVFLNLKRQFELSKFDKLID
jgi:hypothetical protein